MSEKVKPEKKNRVVEFVLKEHKYENLALAILSILAIELGVLLLNQTLTIPATAFLIGEYWKVFAWILVALGVISLVLSVSSFYIPSFKEMQHIKGLKRVEFLWNIAKVIIFVVILSLVFTLYDYLIELLITLFGRLFNL